MCTNGFQVKIDELRNLLEKTLKSLIDSNYVLWDLPYHENIGDLLIWKGETEFLKNLKYKCLGTASKDTCRFPQLGKDVIILLHGGGNFGDIWREHQEFRLKVIKHYPENKIIMFPQTVYYANEETLTDDALVMSKHAKLILCARDRISFDVLHAKFKNPILLLPDMAFCISSDFLHKRRVKEKNKTLFLKRTDKEAVAVDRFLENIRRKVDVRDWPSMEKGNVLLSCFWKFSHLQIRLTNSRIFSFLGRPLEWLVNGCMYYVVMPFLLKLGIRFVSSYRTIYTTRLHVLILSVLLCKRVAFLDNSYGKNSAFYETWLKDAPVVSKMK